jgi:hypothetical protein
MQRALVPYLVITGVLLVCFTSTAQVIRGYSGTQVFANCGNPDPEQPVCGTLAGAESWVSFVPLEDGRLFLNTDGSTFNTVMDVFIRSASNPNVLQLRGCDNDSGLDGSDSALNVTVRAGETNFVRIAGVNGDCGTITFNYNLIAPSRLAALGRTPQGQFQGRVTGHTNMTFRIEATSNFVNWSSLFTTTATTSATLDFVDRTSPIPPRRFYRAVMLP